MFCPKCGERNPDSSRNCSACGCELPDYSVDNTGGAAVGLAVFMTILFTVLAIITKIVADHSSSNKSSMYILGEYVGMSSWKDIYNIAFGFCVFCAVFMFFLIFVALSKKSQAEEKNKKLSTRLCPSCHESISNDATVCIHCGRDLLQKHEFWICPKCKRKNRDYVGTCACGEERP